MSIKTRLIALSLVFILSLLTISTVSYFNTKSSSNDLTNISDERILTSSLGHPKLFDISF